MHEKTLPRSAVMGFQSQVIGFEKFVKLSLVLRVELVGEVGGHVGQEPGPEAGGGQRPLDLRDLLAPGGPGEVDLDVGDLRGEVEQAPGGGADGGGEEGPGQRRGEDGDDGEHCSEGDAGGGQQEVLSAREKIL